MSLIDILNNHRAGVLDPAADRLRRARKAARKAGIDITAAELAGLVEALVTVGVLDRGHVNDRTAEALEQAVADQHKESA